VCTLHVTTEVSLKSSAATVLITFSEVVEHKGSPDAMNFSGYFPVSISEAFEFSYQYSYGILHRQPWF
jgi:hypothetical protein